MHFLGHIFWVLIKHFLKIKIIYLFTFQLCPTLWVPPSKRPCLIPHPLLVWEGPPLGFFPTLAHQVSVLMATSFSTEARQGSPVGEQIPQSIYSFRERLCSSCWGAQMKTELHTCYICSGDLSSGCVFFAWWFCLRASRGSG